MWAHSATKPGGPRHLLVDHLRSTAALARSFAEPFGLGDLAAAAGLLHDFGKSSCEWQEGLLRVEGTNRPVGVPHKSLGARMLVERGGAAALAILGHHGGLTTLQHLLDMHDAPATAAELAGRRNLLDLMPDAAKLLRGGSMVPSWWVDPLARDIAVRLVFSALVDADHLDTAAFAAGADAPQVRDAVDMAALLARFERERSRQLAVRPSAPIDGVRSDLYRLAVGAASRPQGLFRLPAPTGSGKTMTAAGFALHHAAEHGHARVIVAVPFVTITEQNAQVYRDLLGEENVLEHHSNVDFDAYGTRSGTENWDAPFVVTTTVQLFDSLFGRKPSRSRKLHRLANAVVVLDEVQSLPVSLLVPILDGLRLLVKHFGTTVLLASATQPAFQHLAVWREQAIIDIVPEPERMYEQLRRVEYTWQIDPQPSLAQIADQVATVRQALIVVNTTADARTMQSLLTDRTDTQVLHLSTRMFPKHRGSVLRSARAALSAGDPVLLVSTQLIEAGVDVDFPAVYRAFGPADAMQQAAGRANREGRRASLGRVVIFDPSDGHCPDAYRIPIGQTRNWIGPDKSDPDDLEALRRYYTSLYNAVRADSGGRAQAIQDSRGKLDFLSVADGPVKDPGRTTERNRQLAFRMIDSDAVPVVITSYDPPRGEDSDDKSSPSASELLDRLQRDDRSRRHTFRRLQQFIVGLPRYVMDRPEIQTLCRPIPVGGELYEWVGPYDGSYGINDMDVVQQEVW